MLQCSRHTCLYILATCKYFVQTKGCVEVLFGGYFCYDSRTGTRAFEFANAATLSSAQEYPPVLFGHFIVSVGYSRYIVLGTHNDDRILLISNATIPVVLQQTAQSARGDVAMHFFHTVPEVTERVTYPALTIRACSIQRTPIYYYYC